MVHYPWDEIERKYVQGVEIKGSPEPHWPTLKELAKEYQIRDNTMRGHGAKSHWMDKRNAFKADLKRALDQKTSFESGRLPVM